MQGRPPRLYRIEVYYCRGVHVGSNRKGWVFMRKGQDRFGLGDSIAPTIIYLCMIYIAGGGGCLQFYGLPVDYARRRLGRRRGHVTYRIWPYPLY